MNDALDKDVVACAVFTEIVGRLGPLARPDMLEAAAETAIKASRILAAALRQEEGR